MTTTNQFANFLHFSLFCIISIFVYFPIFVIFNKFWGPSRKKLLRWRLIVVIIRSTDMLITCYFEMFAPTVLFVTLRSSFRSKDFYKTVIFIVVIRDRLQIMYISVSFYGEKRTRTKKWKITKSSIGSRIKSLKCFVIFTFWFLFVFVRTNSRKTNIICGRSLLATKFDVQRILS